MAHSAIARYERQRYYSSMRLAVLIPLLLALAACGFTPLHSSEYRARQELDLASLVVEVDRSRLGQLLEAEIGDALNPDYQRAEKLYQLKISLSQTDIPLFINPDGTSARGDIEWLSAYRLTRLIDGKLVDSGSLRRISSYNTSDQAAEGYASFVSIEDAKKRGILELAQDYKLRMANLLAQLEAQQ